MAQRFAGWVQADPQFEVLAPVHMGVVCFRLKPPQLREPSLNPLNVRLAEEVLKEGRIYLTRTSLRGVDCLRVAVGNLLTTEEHLREAWELIRACAAKITNNKKD